MSAAKHTPGPWRLAVGLENQTTPRKEFVWSDAETREEREDASQMCIATVHEREAAEVRLANARLIAAAPEMLEALRQVLACGHENDAGFNPLYAIEVMHGIAQRVISKAEGSQS